MREAFLLKEVSEVLNKVAPNSGITPQTHLEKDLALDSIDKASLIVECEKWFNIKINDREAEGWRTIEDLMYTISAEIA